MLPNLLLMSRKTKLNYDLITYNSVLPHPTPANNQTQVTLHSKNPTIPVIRVVSKIIFPYPHHS